MIVLFDMDGTLFAGDSQLRFARWILKRHGWRRWYLLLVIPALILRALHLLSTEQMKRLFLSYAWGMPKDDLLKECELFVNEELIPIIYPPLLQRLILHNRQGDTTILCSASPNWWTQYVGDKLGFSHTIATPIESTHRVPFFPRITFPGNNKGCNKVIRLRQMGIVNADVGYTDSRADLPMLSICRSAVLINPDKQLRKAYPQAEILNPPTGISKLPFILRCLIGF